ncbi:MAG: hypothetical protein HQ567_06615 [Candidatus Nealsonbacteria bacterium]|nr:hypothetical protein [Candidatus Nealsonbacteria bacterium]
MPLRGGEMQAGAARGLYLPTERYDVRRFTVAGTGLARVFNTLWASALNLYDDGKVTHAAMLHSDIEPDPFWVDLLMDEMNRLDADVVSAVIPICDPAGVTSTAIGNPGDKWHPLRRLTMHEVMELPITFDNVGAGYPDNALLINTGCWLADLRRPFWHTHHDGVASIYFEQRDRLVRRNDQWEVERESEDWRLGRQLHELGCKVYATRAVRAVHHGEAGWSNWTAWGTEKTDRGTV